MSKKVLLLPLMACFFTIAKAQSNKSATAYAITSAQKGQNSWKEIRLVDLKTGQEIQTVFSSGQEIEILNARTGKPVQKKDVPVKADDQSRTGTQVFVLDASNKLQPVGSKEEIERLKADGKKIVMVRKGYHEKPQYDKPFATNSAALAYDKKHQRLYYTPMGINQLRYIDMKSKTPKIYYFEDEAFGTVKHQSDVAGQIARMVIASDGNGYALSNDANHLMRFTTGKKPEITDLGPVSEDMTNTRISIHNGVGGDLVADKSGNLYLITAYRNIWKINIETKAAVYIGAIKGLPEGYQTNGAVVEEGSKIIVCSGSSTDAYYRFDMNTLQAEKVSTGSEVYNASDLANSNLIVAEKKKEEKKKEEETAKVVPDPEIKNPGQQMITQEKIIPTETAKSNGITAYPNPVTDGVVKLAFNDQPAGRYNVQVLDLSGKIVVNQDIVISSKSQVQELKLPSTIAKGNYMVRVTGASDEASTVIKLNVQ